MDGGQELLEAGCYYFIAGRLNGEEGRHTVQIRQRGRPTKGQDR